MSVRLTDDGGVHEAVLVTGPPGSGKSIVSERIVSLLNPSAYVAGDLFFGFVRTGYIDPWLPEAEDQNQTIIEAAALATGRLTKRFNVVYDGVVGPWYLPTFLEVSGLACVHYAILMPPVSVCVERVATRSNHGFRDLRATEHMWHEFKRSSTGWEPHLLEGTAPPAILAQEILGRVTDGTIRYEAGAHRSP